MILSMFIQVTLQTGCRAAFPSSPPTGSLWCEECPRVCCGCHWAAVALGLEARSEEERCACRAAGTGKTVVKWFLFVKKRKSSYACKPTFYANQSSIEIKQQTYWVKISH